MLHLWSIFWHCKCRPCCSVLCWKIFRGHFGTVDHVIPLQNTALLLHIRRIVATRKLKLNRKNRRRCLLNVWAGLRHNRRCSLRWIGYVIAEMAVLCPALHSLPNVNVNHEVAAHDASIALYVRFNSRRKLRRFAVKCSGFVGQLRQLYVHHEFRICSSTMLQRAVEQYDLEMPWTFVPTAVDVPQVCQCVVDPSSVVVCFEASFCQWSVECKHALTKWLETWRVFRGRRHSSLRPTNLWRHHHHHHHHRQYQ